MSQRREIPGFYFDEEKNRYFAIPKVAVDCNSSEIRNLKDKIQANKRRKLANQQKQLLPFAKYLIDFKAEQDALYSGLEEMINNCKSKGYPLHQDMQKMVNEKWNSISPTRPFQLCGLINRISFPLETCGELSGFKLAFKISDLNTMHQYVFFKKKPEGDIPMYCLNDIFKYRADIPINQIEYSSPSVIPFNRFIDGRPFKDIFPTRNGYLIKFNKPLKNTRKILFMVPNLHVQSANTNDFVNINDCLPKKKSDLTCTDYLNLLVACGYRNGKVEIYHNQNKLTIDFGESVCGISLIMYDEVYYCVISGLNNQLRSYTVDFLSNSTSLYMIYDGYKWKDRLSSNLKQDRLCNGIFGVESEIDNDSSKLEIKFYSILCPKPLRMLSGPFLIKNNSSSQIFWALNEAMLLIYDSDTQIMDLYKTYRTIV